MSRSELEKRRYHNKKISYLCVQCGGKRDNNAVRCDNCRTKYLAKKLEYQLSYAKNNFIKPYVEEILTEEQIKQIKLLKLNRKLIGEVIYLIGAKTRQQMQLATRLYYAK